MDFLKRTSKKLQLLMLYENDVKNTSSRQRLDFKLVKDHIVSYVMSMISVKSTNPIKLEKLCVLKPKIE